MEANERILDLSDPVDLLRLFDFHVVERGNHYVLYHAQTGTLWTAEKRDFRHAKISATITDLLRNVSKKAPTIGKAYQNIRECRPSSKITLIVTTACNMKCSYCYASQGNYGLAEENMSRDVAIRAIDRLESVFGKTDWIQFFGGEPLLNADVIKFVVEHLKKRHSDASFSINTNGTIVTEEIARFLGENMKTIYVSVDGPPDIHDLHRRFRRDARSWAVIMKNLRKLKEHLGKDAELLAEATYTREHLQKGYSIVALREYFVNEMGFDDAQIVWASYPSSKDFEDLEWSKIEKLTTEFIEVCLNKSIHTSVLNERRMMFSKDHPCRLQPCTAGLFTLTVIPNGNIYPCFQLVKDDLLMGNILDDFFPDRRFRSVWKTLLHNSRFKCKECYSCWLRNVCTSCLGKRYTLNGNIHETIPRECELNRKIGEQIIERIADEA